MILESMSQTLRQREALERHTKLVMTEKERESAYITFICVAAVVGFLVVSAFVKYVVPYIAAWIK